MHCGSDVELDDPNHAAGDNPDVLVTIDGQRWGFACKVLQTFHPEGFLEHLRKGVAQIDASPATVGAVIFNFKNLLNHQRYWRVVNEEAWKAGSEPLFNAFERPDAPYEILRAELQTVGARLRDHAGTTAILDCFAGTKSISGYLLWGSTTSAVILEGAPTPAAVRVLNFQFAATISDWQQAALECMSRAATTL
jgi:hypothetical protein